MHYFNVLFFDKNMRQFCLFDRPWLSIPDGSSGLSHRYRRVQQVHCLQWQDITGHVMCQRDGGRNGHVPRKINTQCFFSQKSQLVVQWTTRQLQCDCLLTDLLPSGLICFNTCCKYILEIRTHAIPWNNTLKGINVSSNQLSL